MRDSKGRFAKGNISWTSTNPLSQSAKNKIKSKVKELWKNATYKEYMSKVHKGQFQPKGHNSPYWKDRPKCLECGKELVKITAKYCKSHSHAKEKSWFWKGGVCEVNKTERQNFMRTTEYKTWRLAVFVRDNFACINCGYSGKKLNADHIKPYSLYPELRLEVSNGRTLCEKCHTKLGWHGNTYSQFNYA